VRPKVVLYGGETETLLSDVRALHGIIDAVPHPIYVKDRASRFVIVNKAFCKMMGRSFDQLIRHDDYDFFPREQADRLPRNGSSRFSTPERSPRTKSTSPTATARSVGYSRGRAASSFQMARRCSLGASRISLTSVKQRR
jgi:PAS domain S-box-containing protein